MLRAMDGPRPFGSLGLATVKPGLRVAEPGERIRVRWDDQAVEGRCAAVGFDAARGNWVRVETDDGSTFEVAEITRHALTVAVIDPETGAYLGNEP